MSLAACFEALLFAAVNLIPGPFLVSAFILVSSTVGHVSVCLSTICPLSNLNLSLPRLASSALSSRSSSCCTLVRSGLTYTVGVISGVLLLFHMVSMHWRAAVLPRVTHKSLGLPAPFPTLPSRYVVLISDNGISGVMWWFLLT